MESEDDKPVVSGSASNGGEKAAEKSAPAIAEKLDAFGRVVTRDRSRSRSRSQRCTRTLRR